MAEKEYIERDMFLKIISHKPSCPTTGREDRLINGFISAVKNCPAADVVPGRDFRDCRNELCLRCGDYKQRHLGACDGCRWRADDG